MTQASETGAINLLHFLTPVFSACFSYYYTQNPLVYTQNFMCTCMFPRRRNLVPDESGARFAWHTYQKPAPNSGVCVMVHQIKCAYSGAMV